MRQMVACLLLVGSFSPEAVASQARGAATSSEARISACTLLPTDLMVKVGGINKAAVKYLKPEEEPMGSNGSACEYASVRLQLNPFGRNHPTREPAGKDWQAVTGVGDAAFFRRNGSQYAELFVWTGPHHFTIQFGVPPGGTPESIRPNTIELANAIVASLR